MFNTRRLVILFIPVLFLSGCILVPFVDAFKKAGMTESDRMALLAPEVKHYTEALGWGNRSEALSYVDDESRQAVAQRLKSIGDGERIVESKIDDVEYSESAYKAKVSLKMRYYKVPFYVVNTRGEEQQWAFTTSSGWKLTGISSIPSDKNG